MRDAAAFMNVKILKYKPNLTSPHVQICAALDPRISKKNEDQTDTKERIRDFYVTHTMRLSHSDDDSEDDLNSEEIDKFFTSSAHAGKSCKNLSASRECPLHFVATHNTVGNNMGFDYVDLRTSPCKSFPSIEQAVQYIFICS